MKKVVQYLIEDKVSVVSYPLPSESSRHGDLFAAWFIRRSVASDLGWPGSPFSSTAKCGRLSLPGPVHQDGRHPFHTQ